MKVQTSDGGILKIRIAGSEGPWIFLVHGGPGTNSDYLLPAFDRLAEEGARVVAIDLRGRDGTPAAGEWLAGYTRASDVEDLEMVRRALKLNKISLIGHGFGGVIALEYAQRYSDQLRRVVLMNSGVPNWKTWPPSVRSVVGRLQEPWKGEVRELVQESHLYPPGVLRRYLEDISLSASVRNPVMLPYLRERLSTDGRASVQILNSWGRFDLSPVLMQTSVPTLLLASKDDIFAPSHVQALEQLASRNKRVGIRLLPGTVHFPFLERPDLTFELLEDFLVSN